MRSTAEPAIEFRGVWKIFGDKPLDALAALGAGMSRSEAQERFRCVVAVADVSLAVGRGEVFCVMGLSGSGKSTLVRHVNRLIDPTGGAVLVDGEEVARKSTAELRRLRSQTVAMVFQHVALFPHRTVRENVAFGLELRHMRKPARLDVAQEKLELVHLAGWGDRLPHELSGGMQQRVGLARALASDPEILLMDEPFSALDPLIRAELQEEFLKLTRTLHKTTLFITHDLDEAMLLGDRIAIMKDGQLCQTGSAEALVLRPADEYVASFVRGVSRLKMLKASSLLDETVCIREGEVMAWRRIGATATMAEIIDLAVASEGPIGVESDAGQLIGAITQRSLLLALRSSPVADQRAETTPSR